MSEVQRITYNTDYFQMKMNSKCQSVNYYSLSRYYMPIEYINLLNVNTEDWIRFFHRLHPVFYGSQKFHNVESS